MLKTVKSPQVLNLDRANLRRGSRARRRNRKKSSVFKPRPRETPQRVAIPSDDQTPAPARKKPKLTYIATSAEALSST